jgi:hypothetical protein
MLEMAILGSMAFYFVAATYLDSVYRERMKATVRPRPYFPDIYLIGGWYTPVKPAKREKVDWQNEGF